MLGANTNADVQVWLARKQSNGDKCCNEGSICWAVCVPAGGTRAMLQLPGKESLYLGKKNMVETWSKDLE